ncbi:MAG TPA: GntR family transcriptional regulator [Terriglobia bacterium]|nr:GntR family transcriptional regulator [Terriglobia bacterium]
MPRPSVAEPKSLSQRAYDMLCLQIVQGKLRPGERVLAKNLSNQLGMGRTPVREALLRLQNEGIIICNSRHNYKVRILTPEDIKEIYDTLGILEGAAAGAVPQIISSEDIDRLEEYNDRMQEFAQKGDLSAFGRWNHEFHGIFLDRYGNRMLHSLCDSIRRQVYAYPVQGGSLARWLEKSVREHREIIRMVRKNEGRRLESYFREVHWSFNRNLNYIRDAFHPDGQTPVPF